jgi:hypothetical protein
MSAWRWSRISSRTGRIFRTDVDECRGSPCQHNCANTEGSYSCSCDPGFILNADRHTCTAKQCDASFFNGQIYDSISCIGKRTGEACNVACPEGYVSASSIFTCTADGVFVGNFPTCDKVLCAGLPEVANLEGVTTTCVAGSAYGTQCKASCDVVGYQGTQGMDAASPRVNLRQPRDRDWLCR